jgi:hypothetical protein
MAIDETMNLTEDQRRWFHETYAEWHRVMRPYEGHGPAALFRDLPQLPPEALAGAKVVPQRDYILPDMPEGRVGEIGTQEGLFAEKILEQGRASELHLFDIDFGPLRRRNNSRLLDFAQLHQGDSSVTLGQMPDDHFDWLYIDGDHFYSGVKRDAETAKRKVKPGGYLVFNDYALWSAVEFTAYGVPYAVHELILDHGWTMTHFALNRLFYCDVALRRPL